VLGIGLGLELGACSLYSVWAHTYYTCSAGFPLCRSNSSFVLIPPCPQSPSLGVVFAGLLVWFRAAHGVLLHVSWNHLNSYRNRKRELGKLLPGRGEHK
jgi:hypothetical protein